MNPRRCNLTALGLGLVVAATLAGCGHGEPTEDAGDAIRVTVHQPLSRVLPNEYPLTGSVNTYVSEETTFGRLLDFGLILPRLQQLYAWAEGELAAPGLLSCVENGAMTYAQSISEYSGMQERPSAIVSLVRELLPPSSVSSRKPPST